MARARRRGATPRPVRPQPARLTLWPGASTRRRWLARWRRTPATVRVLFAALLLFGLALIVNAIYQVLRKPTELFFPVSTALTKTPAETWREYGAAFRRYATPLIPPELLAALAQVEGSGNPLVRTYWRFAWAARPFDLYRPASSAVGMYQITDGTFQEARHYCIHHHALVREGAWNDFGSCWFNGLYARILPEDAIELTAAYLDLKVSAILLRVHGRVSSLQSAHLAAVVHLCGAGAADAYALRGWHFSAGQRCGAHDPREYLRRVDELRALFARLASDSEDSAPQ
jgi:Transglycosylase SLT domain